MTPTSFEENIINDALISLFLAIPPREAASLSILTTEVLHRELEELSPELIAAIEAPGDRHALNRSIHRKMHPDETHTLC